LKISRRYSGATFEWSLYVFFLGFLIERDANSQPRAVRAVKIDPGYAFNFKGQENLLYQSFNSIPSPNNLLKHDQRHLQYGNMAKPLLWCNLAEDQQSQFIFALGFGLKMLKDMRMCLRNLFLENPLNKGLNNVN
jgi:hypothetical protein